MNILFFVLKTKLLKNGEAPVLMRITINGDYDDARIQRSVPLNLWNAAKGCSKGRDRASVALNTYIAELHARALEKHKELVLEQALITPKLILKRVFGKDTGMRTLLGTMQEGIEEMESLVNIDYSPVTINRYKNVVKKLRQLIPSYYIAFMQCIPPCRITVQHVWQCTYRDDIASVPCTACGRQAIHLTGQCSNVCPHALCQK